jgi:hypothetical protein
MNHNYIPCIEGELLPFAQRLYTYALAHFDRWGVPGPQTALDTPIVAFAAAFAAFQQSGRGTAEQLKLVFRAKNEAKDVLHHALRTYIQNCLVRNPAVTDRDRERMGLPQRTAAPSAAPYTPYTGGPDES